MANERPDLSDRGTRESRQDVADADRESQIERGKGQP